MATEIERKFLVRDDSYKKLAFAHSHIQQGYICSERGRTVRVRIRDERAYLTIKGPSLDGCLLYTSPSPRDAGASRMPSSA